jgi:hypothetical protein
MSTTQRSPRRRAVSVLFCAPMLGALGAFAACGSSTGGTGPNAGAGGAGSGNLAAGASGKAAGGFNSTGGSSGAAGSSGASGSSGAAGYGGGVSCGPSVCQSGQRCCDASCGSCSLGGICPTTQCPAAGGAGGTSGGTGVTAPVPCFDAGGQLVPEAKSCDVDADCEPMPTANCCGPGVIVGIALRARAYEACYPYPTGCPADLGCASFPSTEDGQSAGFAPASIKVSCSAADGGGKSCRTVSQNASEGTLWLCTCATGASCCQPAGDAGTP